MKLRSETLPGIRRTLVLRVKRDLNEYVINIKTTIKKKDFGDRWDLITVESVTHTSHDKQQRLLGRGDTYLLGKVWQVCTNDSGAEAPGIEQ